MKIAMAQINTTVGDLEGNKNKILDYVNRAKAQGADIVLFPEMTVSGYPPEDLLLNVNFIGECESIICKLIKEIPEDITVVCGSPSLVSDWEPHNSAYIFSKNKVFYIYHKTELPNYGVFDEKRYFIPGDENYIFPLTKDGDFIFAITICEDIWIKDSKVRNVCKGSDFVLNLSASPFHAEKNHIRESVIADFAKETETTVFYCNLVGGQDELVFDGGSMVVDKEGNVLAQAGRFEEDLVIYDTEGINSIPGRVPSDEIYDALVLGTRDYVQKSGFKKVVIGMSGGIDSALTAAIARDAVGADNVVCVSMPSQFNSRETQSDALLQSEILGVECDVVPIGLINHEYHEHLSFNGADGSEKLMKENLQARIRGNILMAYSNATGSLVLSTGNKSEMSVGYCTLYGDMCGGFAVLKDVYKSIVFELCKYLNRRAGKEVILESIINRPPSAELSEGQKDSDSLPPYNILDCILQGFIEDKRSVNSLIEDYGYDVVTKVISLLDKSEYKRRQSAPGVKITPLAFGKDRRMPIVNKYKGIK